MVDISNYSDEKKRTTIINHVNNINNALSTSPPMVYNLSDYELDILVSLVTELVDLPMFLDARKNKTIRIDSYKSIEDIKNSEECLSLYTVNNFGNIRCTKNGEDSYNYIIERRGKKIDDLMK